MDRNIAKVKRRYHPKDWERRARVQEALYSAKRTLTSLGEELEINNGYLSSLVWGTQRSYCWELKISEALGRPWEELFAPVAEVEGRAA